MGELVKQMEMNLDKGSSVSYMTEQEYKTHEQNKELMANIGRFDSMLLGTYNVLSRGFTNLTDKYLPKLEYYNYQEPKKQIQSVNQVIARVYQENEYKETQHVENQYEEKIAASGGGGGSSITRGSNVSGGIMSANAGSNASAGQNSQSSVTRIVTAAQSTGVDNGKVSSGSSNKDTKAENEVKMKEPKQTLAKKEPAHEQDGVSSGKPAIGSIKKSAKERLYNKADYAAKKELQQKLKEQWDREAYQLKLEVGFRAEQIARDLLGNPNSRMSTRSQLRFGDSGKIAVQISGEKRGTWYDFAADQGGDMFDLVQNERGGNFKDAAEYLHSYVGVGSTRAADFVDEHRNRDLTEKHINRAKEEQKEQQRKQQMVSKLYERAKEIGVGDVALRYLSEVRGIDCQLANDIKTVNIYHKENPKNKEQKGEDTPALVAFVRNSEGEVTGLQQILLNPHSAEKAAIAVPKKSLGKIAGSFVDVGVISQGVNDSENADEKQTVTIIAEGLETALSVKQALASGSISGSRDIRILCSLGIFNMRNYQPQQGEKIIIAADNDGKDSVTERTIEKAKKELQSKGAFVEIVKPEQKGDFNDVLLAGRGEQKIRQSFSPALAKHAAPTLEHSVDKKQVQVEGAQPEEKADIPKQQPENQINKVEPAPTDNIPERSKSDRVEIGTIDSKEHDLVSDRSVREKFEQYRQYMQDRNLHSELSAEQQKKLQYIESALGITSSQRPLKEHKEHNEVTPEKSGRDATAPHSIDNKLAEIDKQKQYAKKPEELIKILQTKQEFLAGLHGNLKGEDLHNTTLVNSIKNARKSEQSNIIKSLTGLSSHLQVNGKIEQERITRVLKNSESAEQAHGTMLKGYHKIFMDGVEHNLGLIEKGKSINSGTGKTSCPIKYMDYMVKNFTHEYVPHKQLQQMQQKVIQQQHDKHIEKDMGGPCL
jgi:hypothetical protein